MFGYLIANTAALSEADKERYRASYCGLCRSLNDRFGNLCRITLNYDMTFLVILLESLYEPDESSGCASCLAHPFSKREWWRSEFTDYAADMNVALAYLKALDDWRDDGNVASLILSKRIKKDFDALKEKYPRQTAAMEQGITQLTILENQNVLDPDAASAAFGSILGSLFIFRDDRWEDTLYRLGFNLGRFIYLLDAAVDLDNDSLNKAYNPFMNYLGEDNGERFREILKLFLGEAVRAFDTLPLVKDSAILKNILCSGLWYKFEEKYGSL